jgi:hypothetical protein
MTLQFSVALFAGMAAAMVVPRVRRSVPRLVEGIIWLGLIVACWMAITNIEQANVRYLTESAAWGADQIINTTIGLAFAGLFAWIGEHRFVIANAVVLLLGADILALAMVRGYRQAQSSLPRIKLGEWIEIPFHRTPALQRAAVPYALDEWNRRAERAAAMLGAAFLMWLVQMLIWTRDVVVPRARARQAQAVAAGRVQAAAGLESLHERAVRLQATSRAWQLEHATPAIAGFAALAGQALDRVAVGQSGLAGLGADQNLTDDQVINIRALMSAQSIGWYGPFVPAPDGRASVPQEGREGESDRLAS